MADRPTSLVALRLPAPVPDVGAVVAAARAAGDVDRTTPRGDGRAAQEVLWGGRAQPAAIRALTDDDGVHLLRTEVAVGIDGVAADMARQAGLLAALARHVDGVLGVRDLSARTDHDLDWVERAASGSAGRPDVTVAVTDPAVGRTPGWIRTHGAARFGVPDLELYGLTPGTEHAAVTALGAVQDALLAGGMAAPLVLPDGTSVRLVPVLEAWARLPMGWPGIGRAGAVRGPGLDGPRATLSVLHRPRLGRHRLDLEGVLARLGAGGVTPR